MGGGDEIKRGQRRNLKTKAEEECKKVQIKK